MKPWYKSRTIWANALTLVVAVLGVLVASELVQRNATLVLVLTGVVVPVINVFLRWLTDQPITSIDARFDQWRRRA